MSILINESGKKFDYYVQALKNQFDGLGTLIKASTKEVFIMRREQTPMFKSIPLNKIMVGHFYLINYNYNGNKLYCPILSIDYRVSTNNKHNLYAINLDYLPFEYKSIFFNNFFNSFEGIFNNNKDVSNVFEEKSLPVNFELMFNMLKRNGGFEYSITAFDITKINECFLVSTNLLYLLINVHMREVNIALMKENMKNYENNIDKSKKMEKTIKSLEEMSETYDTDVKQYYKRLKQIENNYKLFENG